jgi:predicted aspartyl protease
MIKAVTVAGRALRDVEAVVSPSSAAPILLGLAALSRLGNYKFEAGRLVFTSEGQPT